MAAEALVKCISCNEQCLVENTRRFSDGTRMCDECYDAYLEHSQDYPGRDEAEEDI